LHATDLSEKARLTHNYSRVATGFSYTRQGNKQYYSKTVYRTDVCADLLKAYKDKAEHLYSLAWYTNHFNSFGADVDKSRHKGPGAEVD